MERDYGIDFEIEFCELGSVTGQFVKIQVKAIDKLEIGNNTIITRLKRSFMKYCFECKIPIILVLVDIKEESAYYIWIQEYIKMKHIDIDSGNKTIAVDVPSTNNLEDSLNNKMIDIAKRRNLTQLQLDLNTCLETAFLLGNEDIYEKLTEITFDLSKTYALEIEEILNDVLILGIKIRGTSEGNKKSELLFNICHKYGNRFTTQQIEKLVMRGSSTSRIGLIALGILYDDYPEEMKKLNLPVYFSKFEDIGIVYYCKLREKYLGKTSIQIWSSPTINYRIDNLDIPDKYRDVLFSKWPNRGDSIILDYLQIIKK
jgi:hypothetical protein